MKKIFLLCMMAMLLVTCDKNARMLDSLSLRTYILHVDRIALRPSVQFPDDDLLESDYDTNYMDMQFEVWFSEDGQDVTISPTAISGTEIKDDRDIRYYSLDEGLFAGGRFMVWVEDEGLQAEYTMYGSGIPISVSYRGKLLPEDE